MILYRFSRQAFSNDISGDGAKLYGGRWNSKGIPVLYTSSSISLALLELLIHSASYEEITTNILMQIQAPDTQIKVVTQSSLKQNWQADIDYCQNIGDSFLSAGKSLLLKVPSVMITEEYNFLVNPKHPAFKEVAIISASKFNFDTRMFKNL